jgi:LPXTG-motif cell wall-anchored protein
LDYAIKDLHVTKSLLKNAFIVLGLALCTSTAAYAGVNPKTPEVDPSLAIGGLTLLAGALAVLRVRRKK